MLVRLKFGRYEGEVRDVAPDVARGLINVGRAEDAVNPGKPVASGQLPVASRPAESGDSSDSSDSSQTQATQGKKRRRRR